MQRMGEWKYSSIRLYLSTRSRWVLSFTPQPLYRWGKSHRYTLDRRLVGPQSRSRCCGEDKFLSLARNRIPAAQPVVRRYTNWAIPAPDMYVKNSLSNTELQSQLHGSQSHETKKIYSHDSRGTQNQEWKCWGRPAAIYLIDWPTDTVLQANHMWEWLSSSAKHFYFWHRLFFSGYVGLAQP
jgi:hypothetical protein